jgi:hypothetical protein
LPLSTMTLTAIEAAREIDVVGAVTNSTANRRRVAPHHLREVAPRVVKVRVVVGVLGLLLVPAMGRGPSELDPIIVTHRSGTNGREVAAGALLLLSLASRRTKMPGGLT